MAKVKYHYALDEHERIVCIDDVTEEGRQSHSYHCLNCGDSIFEICDNDIYDCV